MGDLEDFFKGVQTEYKWTYKIALKVKIVSLDGDIFELNDFESFYHSEEEFDNESFLAQYGARTSQLLKNHGSFGGCVGDDYVVFFATNIARVTFSGTLIETTAYDAEKEN